MDRPPNRRPAPLRPGHDAATGLAAALAVVALALGTGCEGAGLQKGSGESILEVFGTPVTPAQAAAWSVDPYDADKRFRGTLMLANAPWGGEAEYLRLYRAKLTAGTELYDEDAAGRSAAVRGLALHGEASDAAIVLRHLDDGDRLLRWECARALQRLHWPEAVAPLIARLDVRTEPHAEIRAEAATALGQYAERRVVDALIGTLDDYDLAVNRAAARSLHTLTGEDHGYDVSAWVVWLRGTENLFAGRSEYTYPVFHRNANWIEVVVPWLKPPNEVASTPVGMHRVSAASAPGDSVDSAGVDTRNN